MALDSGSTVFCLRSGSPDEDSWESRSELGSGDVGPAREAPWREILAPSHGEGVEDSVWARGEGAGARGPPAQRSQGTRLLGRGVGRTSGFPVLPAACTRGSLLSVPAGKAGYSCSGAALPQRGVGAAPGGGPRPVCPRGTTCANGT